VGARLFETYVDLGHGVRGLAVADDGSATWNLLALTDQGLVPVSVAGGHGPDSLHPGTLGLLVDGKARNADTWIAGGRVFTRLETGETGRYRTFEWQVTDASATKLAAVDLGTVCLDDYWAIYGTCSG
jgi:hypothetical protein